MEWKCIVVKHDISKAQLELFKEQFKNELNIAQKLDRYWDLIKLGREESSGGRRRFEYPDPSFRALGFEAAFGGLSRELEGSI